MRKSPTPPEKPRYPALTKRCKYCHLTFKTKPTYNGQKQEFCIPAHRKAFHDEGRKPIGAILKRQEKHMRQIAREEIAAQNTAGVCQELIGNLESRILQLERESISGN